MIRLDLPSTWAPVLAFWLLAMVQLPAQVTLVGYARLPADTYRDGPPCTNQPRRLWRTPEYLWAHQPVQGISSVRSAGDGSYWALSDNGFGTKASSATYILCIYRLGISWRTSEGGPGTVELLETVELRDPQHHAGFKIVREWDVMRKLTGADFDPESMDLGPDGSFWIGDEFGPYLLQFSREGELISPPISASINGMDRPELVKSSTRPGIWGVNLRRSRGFEGLARHPHSGTLYLLLEGNLRGEPATRLRIFEYMPGYPLVQGKNWRYPLESAGHAIGELSYWPERGLFLVVERDWGHGSAAAFKKVFSWQPQAGLAVKRVVVDLLAIHDPDHLASSDGLFTLPYITIESVQPIDENTLVICNDNNYPSIGGRASNQRDGTEFVLVRVEFPTQRR